jgi:hypothetical protein
MNVCTPDHQEVEMILVRNVFQLKIGKAKESIALWKEGLALAQKLGYAHSNSRLLTDVAGASFYTLVVEFEFESAAEWEGKSMAVMGKPEWQSWYAKVQPFIDGGHREVFSIVK